MSQLQSPVTASREVAAVTQDVPAPPPAASPGRIVLTTDDLLWFTTSEDEEGRLTLGLLECSREAIGVLIDDSGEALGLLLSRGEAEDLQRTLARWLAGATASHAA